MPTTGIINGSLLRLYVDGVAVAYSTSDTLDLSRAMREMAHKDNTSAWIEVAPGQKSATFSTELMFADVGDSSANTKFNTLYASWDAGTLITCLYTSSVNGDSVYSFSAYIESLSLNAANQESVTASASLRVNGAITRYTKTPPGAPTALTQVNATSTSLQISWTAPASVGSSAITDYVVQFRLTSVSAWTTFADGTSAAASATVTGLTANSEYQLRVAAVNATAGQGDFSASLTYSTTA